MSNTLLGFGIFALVAAIAGGGLKAFGFQIGVLKATSRQLLLAGLGIVLIVAARWDQIEPIVFPARFVVVREGPRSLEPGATHSIALSLKRRGPVDVELQSVVPEKELFVNVCASASGGPCEHRQIGVSQPFRQELPAGPGTVSVFNFAINPPVTFVLSIRHPE